MSDAFTPYSRDSIEAEVIPAETKTDRAGLEILPKKAPKILSPEQIRRLGAMHVEQIHDAQLDTFLEAQRETYEEASREQLIETLVDRDRRLALEGRALADGKMQSRLLREFARAMVTGLRSGEPAKIEELVQAMGGEPADQRQLRLAGHTLGVDTDERYAHVEELGQQAEAFEHRRTEK
jgi:hypothetical protein